MALQIRRGTNAERIDPSFIPLEGELVYTTDSKRVYVGDGSTVGGTDISAGIESVLEDSSPQLGGNLDLNGHNITGNGNISINGTITATGNINLGDEGSDNVGIFGSLTTSLLPAVDSSNDIGSSVLRWRNGHFTGLDVAGQINAVAVNASVIGDDSTVLVDASTRALSASSLTFTNGMSINDASNDFTFDASSGATNIINFKVNGGDVYISADGVLNADQGITTNADLTVIGSVTATGYTATGAGFDGDLIGSVFADDSTQIVDSINNRLTASRVTTSELIAPDNNVQIGSKNLDASAKITMTSNTALGQTFSHFQMVRESTSDLSGSNINYGLISFNRDDSVNGFQQTAFIGGREDKIIFAATPTGDVFNQANYAALYDQKFGIGTITPAYTLDVRGDAVVEGFTQFGSLTTTERNALTAANGMVIYNSTNNRFEGYQNGGWINLDDGTAAS